MDPSKKYPAEYLAEDRSHPLINLCIAFIVLEVFFVGLFIASRIKGKTANGFDTYLIPLALPFCLIEPIAAILAVKYGGVGRHIVAVPPKEIIVWLKLQFVLTFANPGAVNLPRLGIIALYLRIFKVSKYRWAAYAVGSIIILNGIVIQITQLAMCIPIQYNWNKKIPGGHCIDQEQFFRWATIPNIVTDLALFLLPMPVVWGLQMSAPRKIGVIITFCLGCIGVFTAIFRLREFIVLRAFKDLTWYSIDTYTWTVVETGVYLIASCLPSLRSLFKHLFKDMDIRSIRTLFGGDSRNQSEKSLQHHMDSGKAINSSVSRPGVNAGFEKLDDQFYPRLPDGTDPKASSTCYTENVKAGDSHTDSLDEMGKPVIRVQRDYEFSRSARTN